MTVVKMREILKMQPLLERDFIGLADIERLHPNVAEPFVALLNASNVWRLSETLLGWERTDA